MNQRRWRHLWNLTMEKGKGETEMSILDQVRIPPLVVRTTRSVWRAEGIEYPIDVLHCFPPEVFGVSRTDGDIAPQDGVLARGGDTVDPSLTGPNL
jgi:hypothetical protein